MQAQTAPPGTSVFFTGVSGEVDENHLRKHFESVGHVVSFRMHRQQPGKDFRSGVVEYMDDRSAQESISRLNGTSFGDRPMRVTAFSVDKLSHRGGRGGPISRGGGRAGVGGRAGAGGRGGFVSTRGGRGAAMSGGRGFTRGAGRGFGRGEGRGFARGVRGRGVGGGRGASSGADLKRPREAERPSFSTDRDGHEVLRFPPSFSDPVLGRGDSIVLRALQGMPTEEAYEAVEQLRVVALERKHDARLLLEETPALRSAVVMILQHAGRLRWGTLPRDAFRADADEELTVAAAPSTAAPKTASAAAPTAASASSAATTAAQPASAPKNEESEDNALDQVVEIISGMSQQDVDRILHLSDADLAQVADPAQRQQLAFLRHHLLEMAKTV